MFLLCSKPWLLIGRRNRKEESKQAKIYIGRFLTLQSSVLRSLTMHELRNQGPIQNIQKEGAEFPTLPRPNENFTFHDMHIQHFRDAIAK